jgi:2-iminoacetate synthase ThiH
MGLPMSALVDHAIESAGLANILTARRDVGLSPAQVDLLRAADLLTLGALADRVRAEDVGAEVRVYVYEPVDDPRDAAEGRLVVLPRSGRALTGLELLREVAVARVTGPRGARVRVDWARCGLELAQVALGFGADELVGPIATKRGLPIAEGEMLGVGKKSSWELAQVVKRRELAACVERGGRVAVFVGLDGVAEPVDEKGSLQEAM